MTEAEALAEILAAADGAMFVSSDRIRRIIEQVER